MEATRPVSGNGAVAVHWAPRIGAYVSRLAGGKWAVVHRLYGYAPALEAWQIDITYPRDTTKTETIFVRAALTDTPAKWREVKA